MDTGQSPMENKKLIEENTLLDQITNRYQRKSQMTSKNSKRSIGAYEVYESPKNIVPVAPQTLPQDNPSYIDAFKSRSLSEIKKIYANRKNNPNFAEE